MEKQKLREIFGVQHDKDVADCLGISKQTFSEWPDTLDRVRIDRVLGSAVRHGKPARKIWKECR